jgi:hypothetical protein
MFNDDIMSLAYQIQDKVTEIEIERKKLDALAKRKAATQSNYDRMMSLVILKIKNGTIREHDGEPIGSIVQSNIPIIAKGICWNECLEKEEAEALYKACISNLEAMKAELNGLQSINRHLANLN